MRPGLVHGRGRETGGGGERSGGRDRLALRRAVTRPHGGRSAAQTFDALDIDQGQPAPASPGPAWPRVREFDIVVVGSPDGPRRGSASGRRADGSTQSAR